MMNEVHKLRKLHEFRQVSGSTTNLEVLLHQAAGQQLPLIRATNSETFRFTSRFSRILLDSSSDSSLDPLSSPLEPVR